MNGKTVALVILASVVLLSVLMAITKDEWSHHLDRFTLRAKSVAQPSVDCQAGGNAHRRPTMSLEDAFDDEVDVAEQDDVEKIENKRKFINGENLDPKVFLPPDKLTNTSITNTGMDSGADNFVNNRCNMDTKAYLPRKDAARTVYQSIAGDLIFPPEERGQMKMRVTSTLIDEDKGYFAHKTVNDFPPQPS